MRDCGDQVNVNLFMFFPRGQGAGMKLIINKPVLAVALEPFIG